MTGQAKLFKEMWESTEPEDRVSFVTGCPLPDQHEMRAYYFSHVLGKGMYPKFKFERKNIVFMTLEEHQKWDHARHTIKNNPLWAKVFALAEKLKTEYYDDNRLPAANS